MTGATGVTFAIATPAATVPLAANRLGHASFTVTNTSGRPLRTSFRIVPLGGTPAEWLKVEGDAERELQPGAAHQVLVRIEPPLGVAEGSYSFRLDAIGVERPDDDFAEGPSCVVTVPASSAARLGTPRGYVATLVGASLGALVGEIVGAVTIFTRDEVQSECEATDAGSALGCAIGDTIAEAILLALLLVLSFALMMLGSTIGTWVGLRVKRYLGAKLTALFLLLLIVPWSLLMLWTVFQLVTELVVVALLAPILFVAVPAVLARGAVLLIRTKRI